MSHEKIDRAPSAETLILWDLKMGLYKLERPKPVEEEWVWMADHVIRLGIYKCFVIVGVRMKSLKTRSDLTISREDLEPIAILPMEVSNGTLVSLKFEKIVQKIGYAPKALVIDHGSDLYAGSRIFCSNHSETQLKYDVSHKIACELRKRLNNTEQWEQMTSNAVQTKKAFSLSRFANFAPPQQRSKARYMNLDSLVSWGRKILDQYANLPKEVQEKVSWILSLKKEINKWHEWVQIGQVTRDIVRKEGFYEGVECVLMDKLIQMGLTTETTAEFSEEIIEYVSAEGEGILKENRLPGTTEALEGLFGGYKRLVGENKMSFNGLGRLILCMSSRLGEFSEDLVCKAMTNVKHRDVNAWLSRAFISERKHHTEQKREQSPSVAACNF
jgi:hypothetical protein